MKFNKAFKIYFYKEQSGKSPVEIWINKMLTLKEKNKIYDGLKKLQCEWPIGLPLTRHLENNLWEMRTYLGTRDSRLIFIIKNKNIFILHGFIKKTNKTPRNEINLALDRKEKLTFKGEI